MRVRTALSGRSEPYLLYPSSPVAGHLIRYTSFVIRPSFITPALIFLNRGLAVGLFMLSVWTVTGGEMKSITFFHSNDLHGHLTPWVGWEGELEGRSIGGLDRLAGVVNQKRLEIGKNQVLLTDGGDALGDTLLAKLTQGKAVLEVMNAVGYDTMTLGNHEVDFGPTALQEHIRQAKFPVIAANLVDSETGRLMTQPYVIKVMDGLKVGLIGLAYPHTEQTTAKKNVRGWSYKDPVETASYYTQELQAQSVDLVVLLSHCGLSSDKIIAERVPGIDIILGAHSHNRMTNALVANKTLIFQAGAHGSDLGQLDLQVEGGKVIGHSWQLITLDGRVPKDEKVAALIHLIIQKHASELNEVVGEAAEPIYRAQTLAGTRPRKRDQESPIDLLFADILREAAQADAALLPGVGYGIAIPKGSITVEALRNLIPHESKAVVLNLTGQQIGALLEQSLENTYTDDMDKKVGGIIQTSGLKVQFNPKGKSMARIASIQIAGRPLESDRKYRVVTNSMLAEGGHRYQTFLEGKDRQDLDEQFELVKSWIKKRKTIRAPETGRMTALQP